MVGLVMIWVFKVFCGAGNYFDSTALKHVDMLLRCAAGVRQLATAGRVISILIGADKMGVRAIGIGETLGEADDLVVQLDMGLVSGVTVDRRQHPAVFPVAIVFDQQYRAGRQP